MNLVKWFRKNNKKLMAVVVILLMIAFIMPASLKQLGWGRGGATKVVAYFGDKRKITNYDLTLAQQDLEILKVLQADTILRSILEPVFRVPDLRAVLLGELLFSDRRSSPALIGYIKQIIGTNKYRIGAKQINDIYRAPLPRNVYWLLLKNEASQAGTKISNEISGRYLAGIYANNPQITGGAAYSQIIGSIVNRHGISEDKILTTFGELLGVLQYARMVCSSEDVTAHQIMHDISWQGETIDVEFVRFDSSLFAPTQPEPTEEEISEQFDKYKEFFAGVVTENNPYGFGYKFADRVQLEYLAVKLDDVSKLVVEPTQEDAEEYYQKYRDRFTEQVRSDPNDPNSPLTERTRSYAEVAGNILDVIKRDKINSKAEMILQDAKTLTEASLEDKDIESAQLSAEQFRQMVGDYKITAEELSKKHGVKIYTGQTGLLSAADMRADQYLGRLYVRGYSHTMVRLPLIVFAINELGASELGPFDVPKPRMYENIGPVRDVMERIMLIARVTGAEKASEPESVDQTFNKSTLDLEQTEGKENADVNSVREKVVEDLKKVTAMDTTKNRAEEFKSLASKTGWDEAVDKFNELYGNAEANEVDPNSGSAEDTMKDLQKPFRLQSLRSLRRISSVGLETLAIQDAGNPEAQFSLEMAKKEGELRDLLYSLVPPDSNTAESVPLVLEFKPDMSYYCVKSVSVRRIYQNEYEQARVVQAYTEDVVQSQSLAAVHFNPENISKRMALKLIKEQKPVEDANAPAEPSGES
ncbi:MAG TPA: hypothetical protein VMW16_00305 [Sedimentisphaerales bacterium]|nr:hypothetical protein [Sedimentisphaerales bacterium]